VPEVVSLWLAPVAAIRLLSGGGNIPDISALGERPPRKKRLIPQTASAEKPSGAVLKRQPHTNHMFNRGRRYRGYCRLQIVNESRPRVLAKETQPPALT
jgi:hypothetical protein